MVNSQQSLIMDLCDPRGPFADSHRVPPGGTCAAARNLAASRLGPSADQAANVEAGVRLRGSPSVERVRLGSRYREVGSCGQLCSRDSASPEP